MEISLKSVSNSREARSAVEKITQKGGLSHVGEWAQALWPVHTYTRECSSDGNLLLHARVELNLNLL